MLSRINQVYAYNEYLLATVVHKLLYVLRKIRGVSFWSAVSAQEFLFHFYSTGDRSLSLTSFNQLDNKKFSYFPVENRQEQQTTKFLGIFIFLCNMKGREIYLFRVEKSLVDFVTFVYVHVFFRRKIGQDLY